MLNTNAPIIFVHYGKSSYLKYTLSAAKIFNQDKRVILIGDNENEDIAIKAGIEHINYNKLNFGSELDQFNKVYKHVAGKDHGRLFWTKFVFMRWFFVYNYLKNNNINRFWHFDSDNLIIDSLNKHETKYSQVDCTEQCNGKCMNGFISNIEVVQSYINTINDLFVDEDYLNKQKTDFIENPHFAFTEMRAYLEFKRRNNPKTLRLNSILDNETFDDCICWKNEMETYESKIWGQNPKKLFIAPDNKIYCKHEKTQKFIRLISINMSWVPTYFIKDIYFKSIKVQNHQAFNNEYVLYNIYKKPFSILLISKFQYYTQKTYSIIKRIFQF